MPSILNRYAFALAPGRLRLVDGVVGSGCTLFADARARDLEGVVGKWAEAPYGLLEGRSSWVKVKNRDYTQARDRHELFERR
jgi:ATP-dependent DNA ligase